MRNVIIATLLALGLASTANAQIDRPLYIVDEPSGADQDSVLYRINPDSGAVLQTIGDIGENLLTIAVDPGTGEVIGLTASDSANADALVRIDPDSGAVSQIVPLIMPDDQAVPVFLDMFFQGSLGPQQNLLFASVVVSGTSGPSGILGIDSETGEVITSFRTELVQLIPGVRSALAAKADAGFNTATMFGCDEGTSEARLVAFPILGSQPPFPDPPPPFFEAGLPDDICMTAGTRANGLTFLGVGVPPGPGVGRELLRVDLDDPSATVTTLGPLPDRTVGIAFGPIQASTVTTLSMPALLLLSVLVLALAFATVRIRAG